MIDSPENTGYNKLNTSIGKGCDDLRLVILGAGGFGRTIADIVEQIGSHSEICFLDDKSTDPHVVGKLEDFREFQGSNTEFYPAFGNNTFRLMWLDRLEAAGCRIATIIHPSAYVSPKAVIDHGTAILPRAMINTDCHIERGCILNMGALIDHGCILSEGTHVCIGGIVKAENRIPAGLKIEAGHVVPDRVFPL